jgi:hypothetical protein
MRLYQMAVACYLYDVLSDHDCEYREFVLRVGTRPDLRAPEHRTALFTWLRQWGCRQFVEDDERRIASPEIEAWYGDFEDKLPHRNRNIWELTERELTRLLEAYDSLRARRACRRRGVGPTGAAKILFAVRPKALVLWDRPIRHAFTPRYRDTGRSYIEFFRRIREELWELKGDCEKHGMSQSELPRRLGKPHATLPKIIDEYYRITKSHGYRLPSGETIRQWAKWSAD